MRDIEEIEAKFAYNELPVRPTIRVLKPSRYGVVTGLDESELADPDELERVAFLREFEPVMRLPSIGEDWRQVVDRVRTGLV